MIREKLDYPAPRDERSHPNRSGGIEIFANVPRPTDQLIYWVGRGYRRIACIPRNADNLHREALVGIRSLALFRTENTDSSSHGSFDAVQARAARHQRSN